jgi:hypothetical protein
MDGCYVIDMTHEIRFHNLIKEYLFSVCRPANLRSCSEEERHKGAAPSSRRVPN